MVRIEREATLRPVVRVGVARRVAELDLRDDVAVGDALVGRLAEIARAHLLRALRAVRLERVLPHAGGPAAVDEADGGGAAVRADRRFAPVERLVLRPEEVRVAE